MRNRFARGGVVPLTDVPAAAHVIRLDDYREAARPQEPLSSVAGGEMALELIDAIRAMAHDDTRPYGVTVARIRNALAEFDGGE